MTKKELEIRLENIKSDLAKVAISANAEELSDTIYKVKMIAFDLKQFAEKLEDFQDGVVWGE
jgi:hypothetical protein